MSRHFNSLKSLPTITNPIITANGNKETVRFGSARNHGCHFSGFQPIPVFRDSSFLNESSINWQKKNLNFSDFFLGNSDVDR